MPQPFGMTTDCRHNTQLTNTHTHIGRQATTPLKFHSPPSLLCFLFRPCNCSRQTKGTQSPRRNCCACFNATMFPACLPPHTLRPCLPVSLATTAAAGGGGAAIQARLGSSTDTGRGWAGAGAVSVAVAMAAYRPAARNGNELRRRKTRRAAFVHIFGPVAVASASAAAVVAMAIADKLLHLNRGSSCWSQLKMEPSGCSI